MRAIDAIIAHGRDPEYEGEDNSNGGRARELTKQNEAKLKQLIFSEVGLARVTIQYCKKRLQFLRWLSKEGVRLALHLGERSQAFAGPGACLRVVCGIVCG